VLAGIGAAGGSVVAIALIAAAFVIQINPWLESLPQRDTDMFGRPEAWSVALLSIVLCPPITIVSAWIGIYLARTAWVLDEIRPTVFIFVVLALPMGIASFGTAEYIGFGGSLVVVVAAIGLAGFISSIADTRTHPIVDTEPSG
jgi:hypothetical protein